MPLSLLISLEVVRYIQAMYISWDSEMFNSELMIQPSVQTSSLNEELGRVNVMLVQHIS